MKILIDESAPQDLRHWLSEHDVETVAYRGWSGLKNGELLQRAEPDFDVLLTADKNIPHQQPIAGTRIAVIVLPTNQVSLLKKRIDDIRQAINASSPGRVTRME